MCNGNTSEEVKRWEELDKKVKEINKQVIKEVTEYYQDGESLIKIVEKYGSSNVEIRAFLQTFVEVIDNWAVKGNKSVKQVQEIRSVLDGMAYKLTDLKIKVRGF